MRWTRVAVGAALCSAGIGSEASAQRMAGPLHVQNFCAAVQNQTEELEPRHDSILYRYQTLIYDAAGVEPHDNEAAVTLKVGSFLNANMPKLLCEFVDFNPRFGNILKLAVARQSDPFLRDALRVWKVDLNQVDDADGATVLDYIVRKRTEAGSNKNLVDLYQRLFDQFRRAGAKLRSELEASGQVLSPAEGQKKLIAEIGARAERGDFSAALKLYNAYEGRGDIFGQPVAPDKEAARRWRQRAEQIALAGTSPTDPYWIGISYSSAASPLAATWFERAAERGNRDAMYELGRMYAMGESVERDLPRALEWMERAGGLELGGSSLLWAGSINGWLGRKDAQIGWYRLAWQQGVRTAAVPGFDYAPGPMRSPLNEWFRVNGIDKCGTTIKGDRSC